MLDATRISPGLYVGSAPPIGVDVKSAGFSVLVVCTLPAEQELFYGHALTPGDFPGAYLVLCPLDDGELSADEIVRAKAAAHVVADAIYHRQAVDVTCMQGRNRSALVAALTLRYMTRLSGSEAADRVRRKRGTARAEMAEMPVEAGIASVLCNPTFAAFLSSLAPVPRPARAVMPAQRLQSETMLRLREPISVRQ
jgi:hypothetical protein